MRLNQLRVAGGVALGVCVLVTLNIASTTTALAGMDPPARVTILAPKRGGGVLPQDPGRSRSVLPTPEYLIDTCRAPWLSELATFLGHHECLLA